MTKTYNNDWIYKTLENDISDFKIKPGESLSENDLCARFNVSRTPIRSVLQRLEENGFVTITPHKPTTVTLLDYNIVDQLIYQRIAIESMVFKDFMKIASPLQIEKIRHLISLSEELLTRDFEIDEFYQLDGQLHEIWFNELQKNYLWESIQKPQSNYTRFRFLDILDTKHCHDIVDEHKELLSSLEKKDATKVEELFEKHLYGGVKRLGDKIYTELKDYFILA